MSNRINVGSAPAGHVHGRQVEGPLRRDMDGIGRVQEELAPLPRLTLQHRGTPPLHFKIRNAVSGKDDQRGEPSDRSGFCCGPEPDSDDEDDDEEVGVRSSACCFGRSNPSRADYPKGVQRYVDRVESEFRALRPVDAKRETKSELTVLGQFHRIPGEVDAMVRKGILTSQQQILDLLQNHSPDCVFIEGNPRSTNIAPRTRQQIRQVFGDYVPGAELTDNQRTCLWEHQGAVIHAALREKCTLLPTVSQRDFDATRDFLLKNLFKKKIDGKEDPVKRLRMDVREKDVVLRLRKYLEKNRGGKRIVLVYGAGHDFHKYGSHLPCNLKQDIMM